jgi:hypothetical protein
VANEIQVGPNGAGFRLLFYYPIPSGQRIKARDADGALLATNVVPTPSTSAPAWAKLTAAEVASLNLGEALIAEEVMSQGVGESDASLLARAQARYATRATALLAEYAAQFKHLNKRFDAS